MAKNVHRLVDPDRLKETLKELLVIEPAHTAIVAVDMHRGHLDPEVATEPVPAEACRRVVASTRVLLELARERRMPVIHVVLRYRRHPEPAVERLASPFKRAVDLAKQRLLGERSTLRDHNVEGSVQTQIMPELGPVDGDMVIDNKKRLSAFYGTDLEILLRVLKIETLVVVGVNTNTCVLCTAFEAANRDFTTVVVSDCVTSLYGDDLHAAALDNIARCFGWVLTLDEFRAKVEAAAPAVAARA